MIGTPKVMERMKMDETDFSSLIFLKVLFQDFWLGYQTTSVPICMLIPNAKENPSVFHFSSDTQQTIIPAYLSKQNILVL